jgi:hypothetical protein
MLETPLGREELFSSPVIASKLPKYSNACLLKLSSSASCQACCRRGAILNYSDIPFLVLYLAALSAVVDALPFSSLWKIGRRERWSKATVNGTRLIIFSDNKSDLVIKM